MKEKFIVTAFYGFDEFDTNSFICDNLDNAKKCIEYLYNDLISENENNIKEVIKGDNGYMIMVVYKDETFVHYNISNQFVFNGEEAKAI